MRETIIKSEVERTKNISKWNFTMGVLHGTFFTGGMALANPDTILPVFLSNFTASKVVIGLFSSLMGSLGNIVSALPQMVVANRLENKIHKIPVLRLAIVIRALCWGFLSLTTYLFAVSHPKLTLYLIFFLLFIFTFMGGIATIPFMDIWGKSLPSTLRGRFFGYRQFWGGIFAIGTGFFAATVLSNKEILFPKNFALLFLFAFILISISYLALGSVKEPVEEVYKERLAFREFLSRAFAILKSDSNYRRFLYVQILSGAGALALPFYILYAKDILKIKLGMVGILLLAQMVGSVLSTLIWGYLADFAGSRKVIQISTLVGFMVPLIAFGISPSQPKMFLILLFVLTGFFITGRKIGKSNFLLDVAPTKKRPTYVGVSGSLTIIVAFFPLIGGLVVQNISYSFLFMVTFAMVLIGFMLSLQLKELRATANEEIIS